MIITGHSSILGRCDETLDDDGLFGASVLEDMRDGTHKDEPGDIYMNDYYHRLFNGEQKYTVSDLWCHIPSRPFSWNTCTLIVGTFWGDYYYSVLRKHVSCVDEQTYLKTLFYTSRTSSNLAEFHVNYTFCFDYE